MQITELQNIFEECKKEMGAILPIGETFKEVKINRCKSSLGRCRSSWLYGNKFQIEVSKHLLGCSKELIKNVLYHEILHTIRGCFNHGYNFKHFMEIANKELGANIEVRCTADEWKIEKQPKYKITCKKCGKVFYREKMPKNRYGLKHAQCGGEIEVEVLR